MLPTFILIAGILEIGWKSLIKEFKFKSQGRHVSQSAQSVGYNSNKKSGIKLENSSLEIMQMSQFSKYLGWKILLIWILTSFIILY